MTETISKELLDILTCPICKSSIKCSSDKKTVECIQCKTKYPIENGIPVILPPKSRK